MAAPNVTPSTLLNLIHTSTAGTTVGNWTLVAKDEVLPRGPFRVWTLTVRGPGNRTFTATYMEQADGSPGRIVAIRDSDGEAFRRRGDVDGWFSLGIREL
jgi:hypothetical protein